MNTNKSCICMVYSLKKNLHYYLKVSIKKMLYSYIARRKLLILRPSRKIREVFLAECPVSLVGKTDTYESKEKEIIIFIVQMRKENKKYNFFFD